MNPFLKEVETRRIIENNFLKRGMLCSLKGFVRAGIVVKIPRKMRGRFFPAKGGESW